TGTHAGGDNHGGERQMGLGLSEHVDNSTANAGRVNNQPGLLQERQAALVEGSEQLAYVVDDGGVGGPQRPALQVTTGVGGELAGSWKDGPLDDHQRDEVLGLTKVKPDEEVSDALGERRGAMQVERVGEVHGLHG